MGWSVVFKSGMAAWRPVQEDSPMKVHVCGVDIGKTVCYTPNASS
ncbi:hypothetical protein GRAN_4988 [Granulicella sibirica]|uniref:Uncharacterized protein n=1 Tax=Granulicella sibirica TaxID=2479048 RepID=A0A4Q0SX51_9BACT|nr:hypothetical protein GRAN_4988 [Granulicella sibirica]